MQILHVRVIVCFKKIFLPNTSEYVPINYIFNDFSVVGGELVIFSNDFSDVGD